MTFHQHRRTVTGSLVAGIALALLTALAMSTGAAGAKPAAHTTAQFPAATQNASPKPTIVFVHGGWADSSGWNDEIASLQRRGYPVIAPANPLRGLSSDADYV
jgi:pimeloyl-ACP methyl ester carboxylesterase